MYRITFEGLRSTSISTSVQFPVHRHILVNLLGGNGKAKQYGGFAMEIGSIHQARLDYRFKYVPTASRHSSIYP